MKLILTASLFLFLAACATKAQLYPEGNGIYSAIALSQSENDARKAVAKKAEETCAATEQRLVVLENDVIYQGAGKELGAITSLLDQAVFRNTDSMGTGTTKSNEDYKATLKFRCE